MDAFSVFEHMYTLGGPGSMGCAGTHKMGLALGELHIGSVKDSIKCVVLQEWCGRTGERRLGTFSQGDLVFEEWMTRRQEMYRILKFTNSSVAPIDVGFNRALCLWKRVTVLTIFTL